MVPQFGFGSFFPIIATLFPLLFLGVLIFIVVKGIREWSYNNSQPVIPTLAVVMSKRQHTSHHHTQDSAMHSSTSYYATFQLTNGERVELRLSGRQYSMLAEGDTGTLTMQGRRFISFER